jgi:hypothetical protein
LDAAASRFLARVEHWEHARWSQPAKTSNLGELPPPEGPKVAKIADLAVESRADVAHGLAQQLADLCASAEARQARPVPRLENDLALPDQVRVMVTDLLRAGAPADALHAAAADLDATAARL